MILSDIDGYITDLIIERNNFHDIKKLSNDRFFLLGDAVIPQNLNL